MFNTTAEVEECDTDNDEDYSPCKVRCSDLESCTRDQKLLCHFCWTHKCSDYCLRNVEKKGACKEEDGEQQKPKNCRRCRIGCGVESEPDSCDTPGWKLQEEDEIVYDTRGFKKLSLKRNNEGFAQTSLYCLQSWRANCDVSLSMYWSDPRNPDLAEKAKATDYVVYYACKGNATLAVERDQMKCFTLRWEDFFSNTLNKFTLSYIIFWCCQTETSDQKDSIKTVQKRLNRIVGQWTISKQEAMCELAKLPMVICSETIDRASLSGALKVCNSP